MINTTVNCTSITDTSNSYSITVISINTTVISIIYTNYSVIRVITTDSAINTSFSVNCTVIINKNTNISEKGGEKLINLKFW